MIEYLTRAAWGAGPVTIGHAIPLPQFNGLVVHHTVIVLPDYDHDGMTAGDRDDVIRYMRQLQHARPDLGDEVPYSFVVFEGTDDLSCIVAEGRGFGRSGAHTIGYNSTRYGVAFAGDYTTHAPTVGMWKGVGWVGGKLADPVNAVPTLEHRDVYATACPGDSTPHKAPPVAQPPFKNEPMPPGGGDDDMQGVMFRTTDDGGTIVVVPGNGAKPWIAHDTNALAVLINAHVLNANTLDVNDPAKCKALRQSATP